MAWKKFWFEGNLAWGHIDTPQEWKRIKKAYGNDTEKLRQARRSDTADSDYFGFAHECHGKETLGEFADKHGMAL